MAELQVDSKEQVVQLLGHIHNPPYKLLYGGGGGIRTHGPLRASGFLDRRTRPGYATPPNILLLFKILQQMNYEVFAKLYYLRVFI